MKKSTLAALVLIAGGAVAVAAQNGNEARSAVMGRGRGGAPFAWNDKDKNGICDLTGQPVGQRREAMGRGQRGGVNAWRDADNDGICDVTGRPVGRRPGAGRGRGRWMASGQPQP